MRVEDADLVLYLDDLAGYEIPPETLAQLRALGGGTVLVVDRVREVAEQAMVEMSRMGDALGEVLGAFGAAGADPDMQTKLDAMRVDHDTGNHPVPGPDLNRAGRRAAKYRRTKQPRWRRGRADEVDGTAGT